MPWLQTKGNLTFPEIKAEKALSGSPLHEHEHGELFQKRVTTYGRLAANNTAQAMAQHVTNGTHHPPTLATHVATVPELLQFSNPFSLSELTPHTLAARRQKEEVFASLQIVCWEAGPYDNSNSYNRGFTKNCESPHPHSPTS